MNEILHHLRNPEMLILLQLPQAMVSTMVSSVVRNEFCPSSESTACCSSWGQEEKAIPETYRGFVGGGLGRLVAGGVSQVITRRGGSMTKISALETKVV